RAAASSAGSVSYGAAVALDHTGKAGERRSRERRSPDGTDAPAAGYAQGTATRSAVRPAADRASSARSRPAPVPATTTRRGASWWAMTTSGTPESAARTSPGDAATAAVASASPAAPAR